LNLWQQLIEMADPESLRRIAHSPAPFSTWLGVVLLFVLFGIIVLAVVGPSPRGSDYEETRAKKRTETLKKLREETDKELTTYTWVDKNKGVARIPISRAMELAITELAQKKPAPAGPIATPASAEATAGKPPVQASPAVAPNASAVSPAPPGSPQPGAAQPQGAAVSSPPPQPATQTSSPVAASPVPAKSP
jgi:hypothetical protein